MASFPLRTCANCGADAARVDAATLACTTCGCDPFTTKIKPMSFSGDGCTYELGGDFAPAHNAWGEPINARTPDGGSRAYRALLDQMWSLHVAKNTGYAGHSADPWANFRMCEAFGVPAEDGVLTRMSDKWSRLQSIWRNPERDRVGESIKDTLIDLSAYALILVCLLQEDE